MTTFVERERAIEAHFVLAEMQEFRKRAQRYKRLGRTLADRIGLQGDDYERFVEKLAIASVSGDDKWLVRDLGREAVARGLLISPEEIRSMLWTETELRNQLPETPRPKHLSWLEFVATQVLMLFGLEAERDQLNIEFQTWRAPSC